MVRGSGEVLFDRRTGDGDDVIISISREVELPKELRCVRELMLLCDRKVSAYLYRRVMMVCSS